MIGTADPREAVRDNLRQYLYGAQGDYFFNCPGLSDEDGVGYLWVSDPGMLVSGYAIAIPYPLPDMAEEWLPLNKLTDGVLNAMADFNAMQSDLVMYYPYVFPSEDSLQVVVWAREGLDMVQLTNGLLTLHQPSNHRL